MSAQRILPASLHPYRRFSVIGTDSENTVQFVKHAALLWEEGDWVSGERVGALHMCPPLEESRTALDVVGCVDDLTEDERRRMATWTADIRTRIALDDSLPPERRGYIIDPPYLEEPSEDSERSRWRFSCIGLVIKCYEEIGIRLLDWQSPQMPVPRDIVFRAGYQRPLAVAQRVCPRWFGVPAPYRVVLPGYVFLSLNRSTHDVRHSPYLPSGDHEAWFPAQGLPPAAPAS